jgi:hypothetical protein
MPQSEKFFITWEGLGWVTKTLCTQNEANAFSLWNNNLGYQGILESWINPFSTLYTLDVVKMYIHTYGAYCEIPIL